MKNNYPEKSNSIRAIWKTMFIVIVLLMGVFSYTGVKAQTLFDVTGTSAICDGATATITLSGSQSGSDYMYQLLNNGTPV